MISSSAIFYFLDGIIVFGVSYKFFASFKKVRNSITRNFFILFLGLSIGCFLWSIPVVLFPQNNFLLNFCSLLGEAFMFTGFAFGMRSFAATRFPQISQNFVSFLTALSGAALILSNAVTFGSSYLNPQGIIIWNFNAVALCLFAFMVIVLTLPLAIEFFGTAKKVPETKIRYLLFGFASILMGTGGILAVINIPWQMILFGHIILFLGVVLIGFATFFKKV